MVNKTSETKIPSNWDKIDKGGLASFFVTIGIVIIFFRSYVYETIINVVDHFSPAQIIVLILLLLSFVSIWISIRLISYYSIQYLSQDKKGIPKRPYSQSDIFTMISYVLTTNLIFTLINSLQIPSTTEIERVRGLVVVAIQGIIIGLIIFLPKTNKPIYDEIGGYKGYISILLSLVIALLVLVFVLINFLPVK